MTPVLIYTDTERIEQEKNLLNASIPALQAIYDALLALGVTATLNDLNTFITWIKVGNGAPDFIKHYVTDKILGSGPWVISGVPVTREAMLGFVVVPEVGSVENALHAGVKSVFGNSQLQTGIRVNLLTLTDGIIAKASTAFNSIMTEFSYYTKTDASAQLATDLQAVCDALNTYDAAHGNCYTGQFSNGGFEESPIFKGISLYDEAFVPSLGYIRDFEQTGRLN